MMEQGEQVWKLRRISPSSKQNMTIQKLDLQWAMGLYNYFLQIWMVLASWTTAPRHARACFGMQQIINQVCWVEDMLNCHMSCCASCAQDIFSHLFWIVRSWKKQVGEAVLDLTIVEFNLTCGRAWNMMLPSMAISFHPRHSWKLFTSHISHKSIQTLC